MASCVIIFAAIVPCLIIGLTCGETRRDEFMYTHCSWSEETHSRCIETGTGDNILNNPKYIMSEWPDGPYALLTPTAGCPESFGRGWRSGYLSLTWKHPQILASVSTCAKTYGLTVDAHLKEHGNKNDTDQCVRHLSTDDWPNWPSNLLGPYHRYAFRLNFCYKTQVFAENPPDDDIWPRGTYSIFGDGNTCPSGFKMSNKTIHLPEVTSWRQFGLVPNLKLATIDVDNSTILSLTTCDHIQTENSDINDWKIKSEFSFILLSNGPMCPSIERFAVIVEKFELRRNLTDDSVTTRLFDICYYSPKRWIIDPKYFYSNEEEFDLFYYSAYEVQYPNVIYGNKTISSQVHPFYVPPVWSSSYTKLYIPWILIDLGMNVIIQGIHFTNARLPHVDSKEYTGTLNFGTHHIECQRWDEQYPHSHGFTEDAMFPDETISDAENYCRNPDDNDNVTWCFTQNKYTRWQYCDFAFAREDLPISACFIADNNDRWKIEEFDSSSCVYTIEKANHIMYWDFYKRPESRYITLVGRSGYESSKFNSWVRSVGVLTPLKYIYDSSPCITDLGMGDESIDDDQITASSWKHEFPPIYARPFHSGWCSASYDTSPYITIDLLEERTVEGITIFNWELIVDEEHDGKHSKRFIHYGSKQVMVSLYSEDDKKNYRNYTNMTFSLDMYLPVEQPQTFYFRSSYSRYVTVYSLEAVTQNNYCLRFELHGCQNLGSIGRSYPTLMEAFYVHGESGGTAFLLNYVYNASVLSSINFPEQYAGGTTLTWIIDIPEGRFIQIIFTNTSLNKYKWDDYWQCQDKIEFFPTALMAETASVTSDFNNVVAYIETSLSYVALAFRTCKPISRPHYIGNGFKAIVKTQEIPNCFFFPVAVISRYECHQPLMYITSVSRFNLPLSNIPDKWVIHRKNVQIHMEILYFNVRCDVGSLLTVTDKFSGEKSFCNLRAPPKHIFSDSETVHIDYVKGENEKTVKSRLSADEGIQIFYKTITKQMKHLIDLEKSYIKGLILLSYTDGYTDAIPITSNMVLAKKACSTKFGKCYYIYSAPSMSWNMIGNECSIRKSRLVTIHSDEEHELLTYMLRTFRLYNIGYYTPSTTFGSDIVDPDYFTHIGLLRIIRSTRENVFVWEDGSPLTFSAWKTNEPSTNGDCTRMSFHLLNTNNTWETEHCDKGRAKYFICERKFTQILNSTQSSYYAGDVSKTISGKECKPWSRMWAQYEVQVSNFMFPEKNKKLAKNYCRDTFKTGIPWCYNKHNPGWELCFNDGDRTDEIFTRNYNGRLSKTVTGKTCTRWDSLKKVNDLGITDRRFPNGTRLIDSSNYCRDPNDDGSLYCMAINSDKERELELCHLIDTASDRCYTTHSMYSGQWSRTLSGKNCQRWDVQIPHVHEAFLDSQFPDGSVTNASNFCRDPYQDGYLWCFTTDPATRIEYCVVEYKYHVETTDKRISAVNETFMCGDGYRIPTSYVCNGISNCADVSDETNCIDTVNPLMRSISVSTEKLKSQDMYGVFECECKVWVSLLARCDGIIDCIDGTDEIGCLYNQDDAKCSKHEYACDRGECIHISQMCDFIADCVDGSDENCNFPLCSSNEYRCNNQKCIPKKKMCDAVKDCLDGSDENSCETCNRDAFRCDLNKCIPRRLVCDKHIDCKDEKDEQDCLTSTYGSCEELWLAGYRKSTTYNIGGVDVECWFEEVTSRNIIYTHFNNFEIIRRSTAEVIQFQNDDSSVYASVFQNDDYVCIQNITQKCVPAYQAAADSSGNTGDYKHCNCFVLMTYIGFVRNRIDKVFRCGIDVPTDDLEMLYFTYINGMEAEDDEDIMSTRGVGKIVLHENRPLGIEITFGPAVCRYENFFSVTSDVGCDDEDNVFPNSTRCVYDKDTLDNVIGCRSGQHLQGCEQYKCPDGTVKCPGSFCLPSKFLCDGEIQCPGAEDEEYCGCLDKEREIVLLYEDIGQEGNEKLEIFARRMFTDNSVVRTLRFQTRIVTDQLQFTQTILDISDSLIKPNSVINRYQYICNYSVSATEFLNSVEFSIASVSGLIYFQSRNTDKEIANQLFMKLKFKPNFLLYRVQEAADKDIKMPYGTFPFVNEVFVRSKEVFASIGTSFFPDLCAEASKTHCPNQYKCAASKTCIPLKQVCDGYAQCLFSDDERNCEYSCPDKCTCVEYTSDCSGNNIDITIIDKLNKKSRALDLSRNPSLQTALAKLTLRFPSLISLNISKCDIVTINDNLFRYLANLRILDLSYNNFHTLSGYSFAGLQHLVYFHFYRNRKKLNIEPFAFTGLTTIKNMEIVGTTIDTLSNDAFSGLRLDSLNLSDNIIIDMEDDVFFGLDVKILNMEKNEITNFDKGLFRGVSGLTSIRAPAYKYCCVRPTSLPEENCFPYMDEFSSCDDLLRFPALQMMLWIIGILALLGNVLSVMYRLYYDRERASHGYGVFVTNLAVADFIMGVYLIIIAIADSTFRKRYIFMDDMWRSSVWCTLAGFLSTVSSEASVFFLCLITLDRFLVIKYPFGQVRFNAKLSKLSCFFSWIVAVSIGLIPIIHTGYFKGRFYSKSGICIALPLTRERHAGWLYSVMVFIGLNFVTFCLLAMGQLAIYYELKNRKSGILKQGKKDLWREQELRVARNLFFVVATDFLCWFPIGCMGIMSLSGSVVSGDVYAWTAVFVLPVNSALNPILYTLTAIRKKNNKLPQIKHIIKTTDDESNLRTHPGKKQLKGAVMNGIFRYFLSLENNWTMSVCLSDIRKNNIMITPTDAAMLSLNILRCLTVLHKNSLVVGRLDINTVYTYLKHGKITGDIQLRREPLVATCVNERVEDIYNFAQVLRHLLVWCKKIS